MQEGKEQRQSPTGAVTLTFDPVTHRVISVRLAADWQRRIERTGLAEEIRSTANRPMEESLDSALAEAETLVDSLGQLVDSLPRRAGEKPRLPAPAPWNPPALSPETMNHLMRDVLRVAAQQRNEHMNQSPVSPTTGRSGNRKVEVVARKDRVDEVRLEETWLGRATIAQLSSALTEAFSEAYHAAETDPVPDVDTSSTGATHANDALLGILRDLGFPVPPGTPTSPVPGRRGHR